LDPGRSGSNHVRLWRMGSYGLIFSFTERSVRTSLLALGIIPTDESSIYLARRKLRTYRSENTISKYNLFFLPKIRLQIFQIRQRGGGA